MWLRAFWEMLSAKSEGKEVSVGVMGSWFKGLKGQLDVSNESHPYLQIDQITKMINTISLRIKIPFHVQFYPWLDTVQSQTRALNSTPYYGRHSLACPATQS